ncbi:MAG: N-acetyltransferase [Actinomycetota bacterium]|nr:N-acetyltransferase [Actinomycetota bacterium]
MNVTVREAPELNRFEALVDGRVVGFAVYHVEDGRAAMPHTEVEPGYGGHGVATELVRTILDTARARDQLVLPYCPFVSALIRKHPEYLDLVPEQDRGGFGLLPIGH